MSPVPVGIMAGGVKAGGVPLVGTYRTTVAQTTGTATYTYSSIAIGTASATRNVVLTVISQPAGLGFAAPSTVTIGGVSASLVTGSHAGNTDFQASVWQAVVPTGTTATIVVTFPVAHIRTSVGVWTIDGVIATTSASSISTSATPSRTVTGASGGFIIAGVYCNLVRTFIWTNATERADNSPDGSRSHSSADATTVGSTTITATESAAAFFGMAVCAFGP